ncbi:HupE/UreJ family protein [Pelagibius marinus]|uniref:HupE/UreJ family protein n=1 Tax=Pelagibius marinus TaxID=2762760 RepID=UPI0018731672|nr:HupE/UreJ family protein [Pelagibius marinus]
MRKIFLPAAGFLAAATLAGPASAHTGGAVSGLTAGLAHPFLGLDHLLVMLAVGLWAAAQPAVRAWRGPALFLALLAVGGLTGLAGGALPFVEPGILASVVVLGAMVFAARRLPAGLGLAVLGGFALLHGQAHGAEAVGGLGGYFVGFLAASAGLHLGGFAAGQMLARWRYGLPAAGLGLGLAGLALVAG